MVGIDISEHNGNINLQGYDAVIIRAGWGLGHADKKFTRNVKECERLGVKYGVYWYSYALDVATARKEAEYFAEAIKGCNVTLGAWLDMEDADAWKRKQGWRPSVRGVSDMVIAFCDYMERAGWYSGVYLSYDWLQYLDGNTARFDRWVAHWSNNDGNRHGDYRQLCSIHQYTSKPLDKDYFYKTRFPNPGAAKVETVKVQTVDEMVKDVILGKYGDGAARKKKLGVNYDKVQARVNEVIGLARRTMEGDFGNGSDREKKLGANYDIVQWVVNVLMEK